MISEAGEPEERGDSEDLEGAPRFELAIEIEGGVGTAEFFAILQQDDFALRLFFEFGSDGWVGERRYVFKLIVGIAFAELID